MTMLFFWGVTLCALVTSISEKLVSYSHCVIVVQCTNCFKMIYYPKIWYSTPLYDLILSYGGFAITSKRSSTLNMETACFCETRYLLASPRGVTTQKANIEISTTVRTSHLTAAKRLACSLFVPLHDLWPDRLQAGVPEHTLAFRKQSCSCRPAGQVRVITHTQKEKTSVTSYCQSQRGWNSPRDTTVLSKVDISLIASALLAVTYLSTPYSYRSLIILFFI